MKKLIYILLTTTILSCTKSEVAYEPTHEIGFTAAAGNITKAAVSGSVYPTELNMYINSYVHATNAEGTPIVPTTPDYIDNGEFTYVNTYGAYTGDNSLSEAELNTKVWGGGSSKENRHPYYWPNQRTLHFSGYSKSGSYTSADYNPSTDQLTIIGYNPGTGNNDLMWFPSTKYTNSEGYGKNTTYVPVSMYHTCSWITFMVQGDQTTGGSGSTYTITSLTMKGLDMTANVVCTGNESLSQSNLSTYIKWSENTTQTETYNVSVKNNAISLASTYQSANYSRPKNIETDKTKTEAEDPTNATKEGSVIVIPQTPGTIDIAWTYKSSTNAIMSDSATGLSLSLGKETVDGVEVEKQWQPGKHYIYTITIKANEIVIAPTPALWTTGNSNVTVE